MKVTVTVDLPDLCVKDKMISCQFCYTHRRKYLCALHEEDIGSTKEKDVFPIRECLYLRRNL